MYGMEINRRRNRNENSVGQGLEWRTGIGHINLEIDCQKLLVDSTVMPLITKKILSCHIHTLHTGCVEKWVTRLRYRCRCTAGTPPPYSYIPVFEKYV